MFTHQMRKHVLDADAEKTAPGGAGQKGRNEYAARHRQPIHPKGQQEVFDGENEQRGRQKRVHRTVEQTLRAFLGRLEEQVRHRAVLALRAPELQNA